MDKQASIELTGLKEENPRDFLAALGLMATLQLFDISNSLMSWDLKNGNPSLTGSFANNWADELSTKLASPTNLDEIFSRGRVEGISIPYIRSVLSSLRYEKENPLFTILERRLLPGLTGQLERAPGKRRSRLILEKASKSMLTGVRKTMERDFSSSEIIDSFSGRARLRQMKNSPRLNPEECRMAAYRAKDPDDEAFKDIPILNVFSILGLIFFPVIDLKDSTATMGVETQGKQYFFRWPIWTTPINSDEVMTLLHQNLLNEKSVANLTRQGIDRIWASRIMKIGDNEYLSPAQLIC